MSAGTPPDVLEPVPSEVSPPRRRRRRSPGRRRAAILVLAPIVAAAVLVAARPWGSVTSPVPPSDTTFTLAWVVEHRSPAFAEGTEMYVMVLGASEARPPFAVVIPNNTTVDLPGGGPPTVGEAITSPELLIAATQATLNRRVDHYLLSTEGDVLALVDRLGGITVQVEEGFLYGGEMVGPGQTKLFGAEILTYLESVPEEEIPVIPSDEGGEAQGDASVSRWQDVLWGLFSATGEADKWEGPVGESDVAEPAPLLARVLGALVTELPTLPGEDGRLLPDGRAIDELVRNSFPTSGGELVRVVVLNGNGLAGQGLDIGAILAPHGFRVVAAQNAASFRVRVTAIIAASEAFVAKAEEARKLLGVGRVYVGPQPTGVADLTIVAGKDFGSG
jgi:hypothetical protein